MRWTIAHICRIAIWRADHMLWRCAICFNSFHEIPIEDELNKGIRRMHELSALPTKPLRKSFCKVPILLLKMKILAGQLRKRTTMRPPKSARC